MELTSMSGSMMISSDLDDFSGNIQVHPKNRLFLFRCLIVINLTFSSFYIWWRINHSINYQALWISIPLLIAEIYAYLGGILFFTGLWKPIVRQVRSLQFMAPPIPVQELPTVDVFITCYNEPVEMVAETAKAALAINYPATKLRVYILDDGNSTEMRAMAEQLCLEELQTPALIQAADQQNTERLQLQSTLRELEYLLPELAAVEQQLHKFQLQTKTRCEALAEVLSWFTGLKPSFIPQTVWLEVQTALGEGFDNVVCHAHHHLSEETPIDIQVTIHTRSIELEIWDRGSEFDCEAHLLNAPAQIDDYAERGRGFLILQQIVDYISYVRMPDQRNRLLLIKSFIPADLDQKTDSPELLSAYLQSCQKLLRIDLHDQQISAYLKAQHEKLSMQLYQKECELSDLARCRYIARSKPVGKPHHAKAGNINYAIFSGETSGDLILTLDADHIPKPHFLQRIIPYFFSFNVHTGQYQANRIAFVQTPQAFYNLPSGDPFGHQAHLFYGIIQQAKDGMNAAFYTGTNAVLRREALINVGLQNFADEFLEDEARLGEFELVGGVSSNSITEDMNTAMRLHAAGWKSIYHNEVLAEGLAPDDLSSALKQKLRWAQGTIQVFVRENPLTKPGLSLGQRLQYFQTIYSYFSGFFIVIFIACPILFFFTGVIPVDAYGADFALHFVPAFVLNRLTMIAAGWGVPVSELWRSEQYAIGLFPLYIQAVWSVMTGRSIKFNVTPKQRQAGRYFSLVMPQLFIVAVTGLGIIWCLIQFLSGSLLTPWAYALNTAWALYNIALLSGIIRAAVWQPPQSN
jgi:cellulose synthase (UDP-forming)